MPSMSALMRSSISLKSALSSSIASPVGADRARAFRCCRCGLMPLHRVDQTMDRLERRPRHAGCRRRARSGRWRSTRARRSCGNGRAGPRGSRCSCRPAGACRRPAAPTRLRASRARGPDCACSQSPVRPARLLTSKSLHSGGMLTKSVSAPARTTRTNSRSWRPRSLFEIDRARERRQPAGGIARRRTRAASR